MFTVIVETQKDGEERSGQEAFLARMDIDRERRIEHHFALEVVDYNNRRAFAMLAEPGEIFTACRWRFDGETVTGGELWFTIDASGAVYPLERREALDALYATEPGSGLLPGQLLTNVAQVRIPPSDVFCRRNDIIPEAPPARPLD